MNSQSNISQDSLPQGYLTGEVADDDQQRALEAELLEPPFDRWLHLADDLLRDWPATRSRAGKM